MSDVAAPPTTTPAPGVDSAEAKPKSTLPPPNSKNATSATEPPKPGAATATEPPKPAEKRKYKLKVDGQELEEELSDEEIGVRLQKARAADKRMQESAEVRKAARQLLEDIRKDPWAVLSSPEFGVNLEEIAEQRLAEKYKAELMTEEQRKAFELQKQVEAYQKQEQYRKDAETKAKREQMEREVYAKEEKRFMEAAEKHGLPKDLRTLALMAEVALANHEYGIELSPEQIAMEVNSRLEQPLETVRKLKGDALLKRLGDSVVQEVLRAKVAEFKAQRTADKIPTPSANPPGASDLDKDEPVFERTRNSLAEWRKWRRS